MWTTLHLREVKILYLSQLNHLDKISVVIRYSAMLLLASIVRLKQVNLWSFTKCLINLSIYDRNKLYFCEIGWVKSNGGCLGCSVIYGYHMLWWKSRRIREKSGQNHRGLKLEDITITRETEITIKN
jgi:hypothetical protein